MATAGARPEHNRRAMSISEAVLYDRFAQAREEAVKLTDRYWAAPSDAPYRDELWDQVVRQTETARALLEKMLKSDPHDQTYPQFSEKPRQEVHAGRDWPWS